MNLKAIDAALAAYRTKLDDVDNARLTFFRALWGVQDKISAQVVDTSDNTLPKVDEVRSWVRAGESVLLHAPANIDASILASGIERVAACFADQGGFSTAVHDALKRTNWNRIVDASPLDLAGKDPAAYLECFVKLLGDDGMSQREAEVGVQAASLALRAVLEPHTDALALTLEAAGVEPRPVRCPVCGGEAAVARVGSAQASQGRSKELWCAQCGCTWEFERVRCARCGTQNQGHLHYFNLEGDEAHRLATCDECGSYVRTVYQEEALVPFSFEVEDVIMAKLDLVAYRQAASEAAEGAL